MQDDKSNPNSLRPRDVASLLLTLVTAHRACLLPFLRRDFGPRAFGFPGLMGLFMILMYGGIAGVPEMIYFLWVWLGVIVVHRIRTGVLMRRGWAPHSMDQGYPAVAMKFPFVRTEVAARGLEPLLCLFAGVGLCPLSENVGGFVMLGIVSLTAFEAVSRGLRQVRIQRMRDGMIEQRISADALRRGRDWE